MPTPVLARARGAISRRNDGGCSHGRSTSPLPSVVWRRLSFKTFEGVANAGHFSLEIETLWTYDRQRFTRPFSGCLRLDAEADVVAALAPAAGFAGPGHAEDVGQRRLLANADGDKKASARAASLGNQRWDSLDRSWSDAAVARCSYQGRQGRQRRLPDLRGLDPGYLRRGPERWPALPSARWKLEFTSFGFVQRGSVGPFFALLQLVKRQEWHDALTAPAV